MAVRYQVCNFRFLKTGGALVMTTKFKLRFPASQVKRWASLYDVSQDDVIIGGIQRGIRQRGYLTRDEFLAVCRWKTPRSGPLCESNGADNVRRITKEALNRRTPDDLKIITLLMLSGVGWPTASVILHFFDERRFPIIDRRALWSLSHRVPSRYSDTFWHEYMKFTRALSWKADCDMRTLDRALWQYSKEKQPGGRA